MCRVLSYCGEPILLDNLLYKTDNSLIKQSYHPKFMPSMMYNLAGFGLAAWDDEFASANRPYTYRTEKLPFYDENLKAISTHIKPRCLLAHIRGVEYSDKSVVSLQNVHPFLFDNTDIAFAHNGNLVGFNEMRFEMAQHMKPEFKKYIKGTTDTEWMYALFLSSLPNKAIITIKDVFDGVLLLVDILRYIRKEHNIHYSSPLNFFISNGSFIVASRYVLDYGRYPSAQYSSPHMIYHSLWYTYGEKYAECEGSYKMKMGKKRKSIIIASEPLTADATTWVEVPEYSFIGASKEDGDIRIESLDIL